MTIFSVETPPSKTLLYLTNPFFNTRHNRNTCHTEGLRILVGPFFNLLNPVRPAWMGAASQWSRSLLNSFPDGIARSDHEPQEAQHEAAGLPPWQPLSSIVVQAKASTLSDPTAADHMAAQARKPQVLLPWR